MGIVVFFIDWVVILKSLEVFLIIGGKLEGLFLYFDLRLFFEMIVIFLLLLI